MSALPDQCVWFWGSHGCAKPYGHSEPEHECFSELYDTEGDIVHDGRDMCSQMVLIPEFSNQLGENCHVRYWTWPDNVDETSVLDDTEYLSIAFLQYPRSMSMKAE